MFVIMNINVIKNTFKPTNTHSISSDISPLDQETKHCDRCDNDILKFFYNKHLQSCKHKNNEKREAKFSIENTDGAFKGHIKIRLFRFQEPSSIMEAVDMVKQGIETIINK